MRILDWNAFDWILIAIMAFSGFIAFRRGLMRAIFGMIGFIGGFLLAAWNYTRLGDWMNDYHIISSLPVARTAAFLLIVLIMAVIFELAGRIMHHSLRAIGLGFLDRSLGAVFGLIRGCLACIGVLLAATAVAPQSQAVTTSVLSPYFLVIAHDVSFLVPQYLEHLMTNGGSDFNRNTPRWINRH